MDIRQQAIRIERVLALLLFATLIGFFVYRVSGIAEVAERMFIETRIRQLQTAVDLDFASLMMIDQQNSAIAWRGINPFLLMRESNNDKHIRDYMGESWFVTWDELTGGKWIFDKQRGIILYRLKNKDLVSSNDPVKDRMMWQVIPKVIEENNLVGTSKRKRVVSVRIKSLFKYNWNY